MQFESTETTATTFLESVNESIKQYVNDAIITALDAYTIRESYYTKQNAAKYVGVSMATLNQMLAHGLEITQVPGTTVQRISKRSLDQFMQDNLA
ncbi:MerR family transcriptional regulator [Secundilactobacillus muriivasis]